VKAILGYAVMFAIVLGICGIAMMVTGRDNDCSANGGHVRGVFAQECVRP
jgi:hypothetical protein